MKMNPTALLMHLQEQNVSDSQIHSLTPTPAAVPDLNDSSATAGAAVRSPFKPSTPLDSSMALTILVLLTALFFMGFFSVYIRRFTSAEDPSPSAPLPSRKGGGLDPSAVRSLPLEAYGKQRTIDDCPICLGEFQERETVKIIPYCGHVFHPRCVDTWLAAHVTCPLCRSAQLFKRAEDVCLDVKGERSTVEDEDTWRTGSCSELADRTVVQRTTGF